MSHLTVVSIGTATLRVVSARQSNGGAEITRAAEAALPADLAAKSPEDRAAAIREALARCGGGNGRTALVIPRAAAILRELELPAGTPEEVQQMVRFQVEKDLPLPVDQVRYSWVEAPAAGGKVRVSVAAVPRERIDPLLEALETAGCRVQSAYVSSYGLASLVAGDGSSAVVAEEEGGTEILVIDEGSVALSRFVPRGGTLADEVSRTILSHATKHPGREVKRVLVAGAGEEDLRRALGVPVERLSLDLHRRADVQLGPDASVAASVCIGALTGRRMPNLLKPPVAVRRFRLKRAHRIAVVGGAIAVMLVLWSQVALADRERELARLKEELRTLEPQAQEVNQTFARARLAGQWMDDRYAWIDAFNALQERIDRAKLWFTHCTADETGFMRVQGKATDDGHVSALIGQLQKSPLFRKVDPEYTRPVRDKSGYTVEFAIKIQLAGLSPARKKP